MCCDCRSASLDSVKSALPVVIPLSIDGGSEGTRLFCDAVNPVPGPGKVGATDETSDLHASVVVFVQQCRDVHGGGSPVDWDDCTGQI